MTKSQVRKQLKEALESLGDLRATLFDLRDSIKQTVEDIKPRKGRKSLDYEQELRKMWLEDVADEINDLCYEMIHAECELEDK